MSQPAISNNQSDNSYHLERIVEIISSEKETHGNSAKYDANSPKIVVPYLVEWPQLCCLGVTIVLGGQYFGWNVGLSAGFGGFMIAVVIVATAYFLLTLSLAELTGSIPFGGKD